MNPFGVIPQKRNQTSGWTCQHQQGEVLMMGFQRKTAAYSMQGASWVVHYLDDFFTGNSLQWGGVSTWIIENRQPSHVNHIPRYGTRFNQRSNKATKRQIANTKGNAAKVVHQDSMQKVQAVVSVGFTESRLQSSSGRKVLSKETHWRVHEGEETAAFY